MPRRTTGDAWVSIGVITRPHGIRGGLRVKVWNESTEALAAGADVRVRAPDGSEASHRVLRAQPAKGTWMVDLSNIDSIERAQALRDAEILVARASLPEPDEHEWYVADLVGCDVVDVDGKPVGTVGDVYEYPSVDALVVRRESGGEIEIPIVDGIVTEIDLAAARITVDTSTLAD